MATGAFVFAILLGYACYDIAKRTTFPGSKAQLPERLEKTFGITKSDSLTADSTSFKSDPD